MDSFFRGYIEQTFDAASAMLDTLRLAQHSRHIYLFGCGGIGLLTLDVFQRNGVQPYAFCSNNLKEVGISVNGLPVVSFPDMLSDASRMIILSTLTTRYIEEMREQLHEHSIFEYYYAFGLSLYDRKKADIRDFSANYDKLQETYNLFEDELSKSTFCASINAKINNTLISDRTLVSKQPIFLDDVITFGDNETYFDVGAFIGDNALRFLERVPNAKVFSFEPDPVNFRRGLERVKENPRITMYPYGCGEMPQTLRFVARNSPNTALVSQAQSNDRDEKTFECEIVRLDNYRHLSPTFISMDIEGAELSALKGAKEMIASLKPKLAIAIYHNAQDFWRIPEYILSLRSDYQFYVRTSHLGGEGCVGYFL